MTKRRLCPPKNTPEKDKVYLPEPYAVDIIEHFVGKRRGLRLLDPCAGKGVFVNNYPEGNERIYCEIDEGRDFFEFQQPVDMIVSAPPFSIISDFTRHAMTLTKDIVFLAGLHHFTTVARWRDIENAGFHIAELRRITHKPSTYPSGGFKWVAAHIKAGPVQPIKLSTCVVNA